LEVAKEAVELEEEGWEREHKAVEKEMVERVVGLAGEEAIVVEVVEMKEASEELEEAGDLGRPEELEGERALVEDGVGTATNKRQSGRLQRSH
jgi:hypothetical protein